MTSTVTLLPPIPLRLGQHDIVVARLSAAHDRGEHTTPVVACYDCLHGEKPAQVTLRQVTLRKAA